MNGAGMTAALAALRVACLCSMAGTCGVAADLLTVTPAVVSAGGAVRVTVACDRPMDGVDGIVRSPLGRVHQLRFEVRGTTCTALFTNTTDKGFLADDWGDYTVQARLVRRAEPPTELSTSFRLPDSAKTLFVVFWVDDFGSGGELAPDFQAWYHAQAGPIAYLLQRDDTRFFNVGALLSRYDFGRDYLGHHLHAFHWPGPRWRLWLSHRVYAPYLAAQDRLNARAGARLLRAGTVVTPLTLLAGVLWVGARKGGRKVRGIAAGLCLVTAVGLLLLRLNHVQTSDFSNWAFEHDNPAWWQGFLAESAATLNRSGFAFPPVVRHGWNLPPAHSMRYYMETLGVLADASAISGAGTNAFVEKYGYARRRIVWGETPLPYYARLGGDYSEAWDGREETRGLLELPLTFPNFSQPVAGAAMEKRIAALPHGALVSTYLHPWEDTGPLRRLVGHLNRTYDDVRYIRPDDYVRFYMRQHPRPVCMDADGGAHWAFVGEGRLHTIRRTDVVRVVARESEAGESVCRMVVDTGAPLPRLQIHVPGATRAAFDGREMSLAADDTLTVTNVCPGPHVLRCSRGGLPRQHRSVVTAQRPPISDNLMPNCGGDS